MTSDAPDTVASAPDVKRRLDDDFAEWVRSLMHKYHVPGMSVAVVDDGTVESAGYGLAQLPDVPATADTLYRMASTSKAQTAATMGLILKDDKSNAMPRQHSSKHSEKITWSTPIKKILGDDFDLGDEYITQHVTLEDALSNRSSLSGHDFNYGPWLGNNYKDLTRSLRHLGPVYVPFRSRFQYCNAMFGVAGQVMEKLEDKQLDEIARERLWGPLGMHNTFLGLSSTAPACKNIQTKTQTLARGYYWVQESNSKDLPEQEDGSGKGHYLCDGYDDVGLVGPAGDIVSSVNDYSKWVSALLKASSLPKQKVDANGDEGVVIAQELWTELTTPRTIVLPSMNFPDMNPSPDYANISPELYALGWFVGTNYMYAGQTILHHSGGMPGFGTHVFLLPKHKFGVVVAANTQMEGNKLAEQVGRELIGKKIGIGKDERRREGKFTPKQEGSTSNLKSTSKNREGTAEVTAPSIIGAPEHASDARQGSRSAIPEQFDAQSMCGMYTHGAYGQLEVNVAPSSASLSSKCATLQDARIIREISDQRHEPSGSVSDFVMHAAFQGVRTWKSSVLLHPPPLVAESVQTDQHTFLTLEKLWAHGSLTCDSIPDLPKGHGREDDEIYPFKQEALLQSLQILPCGACLELLSNGKKRLGMILANTESTEAAMRQGETKDLPLDDWQMKMVWFDKVE